MNNLVLTNGIINFDPPNETKKHLKQSNWKYMAIVNINSDISEYYGWFLMKRYSIKLNKPLRNAHISFINDSHKDLSKTGRLSNEEVNSLWNKVKSKWNGINIPIMLDIRPRTNGNHWWLNIPEQYRDRLHGIREELGLGRPYFGLHMSIGYANDKNLAHSEYIYSLIKNGYIT